MSITATRRLNRAEIVDEAFLGHLAALEAGRIRPAQAGDIPCAALLELFDSQLASR